jgi:hypothetical protein
VEVYLWTLNGKLLRIEMGMTLLVFFFGPAQLPLIALSEKLSNKNFFNFLSSMLENESTSDVHVKLASSSCFGLLLSSVVLKVLILFISQCCLNITSISSP